MKHRVQLLQECSTLHWLTQTEYCAMQRVNDVTDVQVLNKTCTIKFIVFENLHVHVQSVVIDVNSLHYVSVFCEFCSRWCKCFEFSESCCGVTISVRGCCCYYILIIYPVTSYTLYGFMCLLQVQRQSDPDLRFKSISQVQ